MLERYPAAEALQFVLDFEESVIHAARQRGLDGVICGHIHCAALREVGGLVYGNCGDWVDSCTALVEHADGRLEVIHWTGQQALPDKLAVLAAATENEEESCVS